MKKNQLNIIFDATVISFNFQKNSNRSGIFFTAVNVLNELLKRKDVNVFLYIEPERYAEELQLSRNFYPEVFFFHSFYSYPKAALAKITMKLWDLHNKYHNRIFVRKIISVFILLFQNIFKLTVQKKPSKHYLKNADAFLSPIYRFPKFLYKYPNIKRYIILYDAVPLLPIYKNVYSKNNKKSHLKLLDSFNSLDRYFAISQQTLNDFNHFSSLVNEKTAVVAHLAASKKFVHIDDKNKIDQIKEKYGINQKTKYVFSLCSLEPRKNMIRAVKTFFEFIEKNNIHDLVWAMGGGTWDLFQAELKRERTVWNEKAIVQLGYVDDEDLPILYSGAEWFVYTSQYEGFGLPPLEAMQCGCPVITSNSSSLPEVVGDAGLSIDWDSDKQHVEAYEKYYFDEKLRKENGIKGLERAKLFSWEKTADKMIARMKDDRQEDEVPLNVIYRVCDMVSVSSRLKRCFDVSKNHLIKKCLLSLKEAVAKYRGKIKIYCIADNCSDDIIDFIVEHFPNIDLRRFEKIGNAQSFCTCVELASSLPNGEQVLFLEDDYLFLNSSALELLNYNLDKMSLENEQYVAIMPDDYPDRYCDNAIKTECRVTETGHFLRIDKTTCTFATYTDIIKKYKKYFMRFSKWPKVVEDNSINLVWKKVPLYQPVPAWTLHCQIKSVVPIYLNYGEIKDYIEREGVGGT